MKKIIKLITPPIIINIIKGISKIYYKFNRRKYQNILFDGDDNLFKSILSEAKVYGEYGCGKSTQWVIRNTGIKIFAVDTSKQWVNEVLNNNKNYDASRVSIKYIDVGDVMDWGFPVNYKKREAFYNYTDWIWKQPQKPDTILIDGRFRVCSFFTSLKNAEEGTRIIFDDYVNRPHYHIVENFVPRKKTYGRQCLFIVPKFNDIDLIALDKEISNFRHVID